MTKRILLVEDSAMVAAAFRMLLESKGYDVEVAATAASAVGTKATEPHDLMLLDITLPDVDGLSVIGGLATRGLRPVRVVALTGHADQATRLRCIAAGCDEVLIKPVPLQVLLDHVANELT